MAAKPVAGAETSVPPVDTDAIIAAAQKRLPDRELRFIITFPGTELSGEHHYTALLYGRQGYDDKLFEIVLLDKAGRVTDTRPAPWYLKVILLSESLHFGDYGRLPLQLLWFACTWLTMFMVGNGAWLWWTRRNTRRRSTALARARA